MRPSQRTPAIILPLLITITLATGALAQTPDPYQSSATSEGGWLYICPGGDGQTLYDDDPDHDATVTVTLRDEFDAPLVGYPKEQILLESIIPGELVFCAGGNEADHDTDADGVTTFSGTLVGGGCTEGGLQVVAGGVVLEGPPLNILVTSPDLNGDLRVDFCDNIILSNAWYNDWSICADLNNNYPVDLVDYFVIVNHLCAGCAAAGPPPTVTTSGEIGLFFDELGEETSILDLEQFDFFDFYVVALEAPDGIQGYQYGISYDTEKIGIIETIVMPAGSINLGADAFNVAVVPLGGCLQVTEPTVLVHYRAFVLQSLEDSPICLGAPTEFQCDYSPTGPSYLSCLDGCDWRQFDIAYEGCAAVNGMGPVATEPTTWGTVKALFRN